MEERRSSLTPIVDFRYHLRNLPHWEQAGHVYFVTFRTADGFTLPDKARDITLDAIKFHADKKYRLHACVVMETHAHSILEPLELHVEPSSTTCGTGVSLVSHSFYSLAQIMHSIKSYSSHKINKLLNRRGSVWQDENYDRIIRGENEYFEEVQYIVANPVEAGLVRRPQDYPWLFLQEAP